MSNVNGAEKALNTRIDAVIKSSHNHHKELVAVTVAAFLHAAEHGRYAPLTKLYKGVSATDQQGIRLFGANTIKLYGKPAKGDANERPISFFTYSKENGFAQADYSTSDNGENKIASAGIMKKAVIAAGEKELAKVPLGPMGGNADSLASDQFNVAGTVARFLKTLAREGFKDLALAVNRVVGDDYKLETGTIDQIAKDNDLETKRDKARKQVEKLEKQIEARGKPVVAANQEPAKGAAASMN